MTGALAAHPLLVLCLGLAPLLACELRFVRLRRDGWLLPALGLLLSGMVALLERVPALAHAPAGLARGPWLAAWLLGLYLPLALLSRLARRDGRHLAGLLLLLPLPVFWPLLDLWGGRVPAPWTPAATGLAAFLLLAAWTGLQEKARQNRAPAGLEGLPFRLLSLTLILLLAMGLEALWAGRLP
jgi:hypothetical protein